jgi:dolichyl-phosphate-mannose--protein O-mannosyl transferase
MLKKILVYLKLQAILCLTICVILGTDYKLLNNTKGFVLYCFMMSNLLIYCFYYFYKLYELFKEKVEE